MTRSKLSRSAIGAALGTAVAISMSMVTFTPVFAETLPPQITWTNPIADGATFTYGAVPAAPTCTATSEDPAVVLKCDVDGYSVEVGQHTLTPMVSTQLPDLTWGAPEAVTTAATSYTVEAWKLKGFYSPVKDGKITRKAGSTIPFKFKVYVDGVKEKDKAVVASFLAQPVDCTTLVAQGAPLPVTSTHKGFRLKYRDGAFHQNWKVPAVKAKGSTKKLAKPCYDVRMTTQDGSFLQAFVTVR